MVPIRRSDTPGAVPGYWPTAGWRSTWDWKGFVDFEDLPWAYDPPGGLIVTANQAVTASPTPFLTTQWDYGFRSHRIRTLLEQEDKVTPERMAQIQGDTRSEFAPTLVKRLLDVDLGSDEFTKEGQDLLRGWDFTNPIGRSDASASAAYFNAVWSNLLDLTFNDELPDDLRANGSDQWMQAVTVLLEKPRSAWWDDRLTPGVTEGEAEILRRALVEARLDLTKELGKDPGSWEWGSSTTCGSSTRCSAVTRCRGRSAGCSTAAPSRSPVVRRSSTPPAGTPARASRPGSGRPCAWWSTSATSTAPAG